MSDDRPADDPVAALAKLRSEFEDYKTTMSTRAQRRPTGDIERTLRTVPKPDTLFCQGQTLVRANYPVLWQWIVDQGLSPSVFGAGDGTTTFVLPNAQGRVEIAAGTLGSDTYALGGVGGSSAKTLALANMPAHDHNVSVNNHSGHFHSINSSTGSAGGHGGHSSGTATVSNGAGSSYNLPSNYSGTLGSHSHSIDTDTGTVGLSSHVVNESTVGSGTAFDVRQAYIVTNLAIWV